MTQFAVHYSPQAESLLRSGAIQPDRFKCPAWPHLLPTVQAVHPVYIHFPLNIGAGAGDAWNSESKQPVDWDAVEQLLTQTGTPFVNLHLGALVHDYPDVPLDGDDPAAVDWFIERALADLRPAVQRFGADRVMVENDHADGGRHRPVGYLPQTIRRVVETAGCGLLLDVSHARLAAHALGMEVEDYLRRLPLDRIREIHVTGIQTYDRAWQDKLRAAGVDPAVLAHYDDKLLDHLPMTADDWEFFAWMLEQIRLGHWNAPWMIAFEYGGVGAVWQAFTDTGVLQSQIPRLHEAIRSLNIA
jgi:uncharacterized protein (UPF0276 family)